MDTNETMDQMIQALQDQVHSLQHSQHDANERVRAYGVGV
jgi:hypothetical protein